MDQQIPPEKSIHAPDGILTLGDRVRITGHSPVGGHLHLFNLGTAGDCARLVPQKGDPPPPIGPGDGFCFPSKESLGKETYGWFTVREPLSSVYGEPERILVIVTRDPNTLTCGDLHPYLVERPTNTRGGFGGSPKAVRSKLLDLPVDTWDFGLLEMELIG